MAGAGVDARAVELVDWEQKKRIGSLAYVVAACKALRGPKAQIIAANGGESVGGELVLIGNGRFYGGSYPLFPIADLRDGLLEVSVFPRVDWTAVVRCGWGLLTDQLYTTGGVKHFRAPSLRLESASAVPFHLEGENVGVLPVQFSVCEQKLRIIIP
jgi:diacylglycerol kinase family enzyme